jgi:hypothetical protein
LSKKTVRAYDGLSFHQIHLAMKAGVPNLLLSSLNKFQWDRIRISQQNYIHFQIHEWMMGRFSVDFSCSFKVPNLLWCYSFLANYWEEKIKHLFCQKC